jgi:triosephosphate isomerase
MDRKIIAGNWKSNGSFQSLKEFISGLKTAEQSLKKADVIVCPPFVYLGQAVELSAGLVAVGAQNCSAFDNGAYTGEVTAQMLCDAGAGWVIVGHSERRQLFADTDALVADKTCKALAAGLKVMLCVGESLEERESGRAEEVVLGQLDAVLDRKIDLVNVVIAYEPVWAIGTGRTASAEDAQAMHAAIKRQVKVSGLHGADTIKVLYGGSVKGSNAKELFSQKDIDGALVGGASLKVDDFLAIIAGS